MESSAHPFDGSQQGKYLYFECILFRKNIQRLCSKHIGNSTVGQKRTVTTKWSLHVPWRPTPKEAFHKCLTLEWHWRRCSTTGLFLMKCFQHLSSSLPGSFFFKSVSLLYNKPIIKEFLNSDKVKHDTYYYLPRTVKLR